MMYWDDILQEVLNKDNPDYTFRLTSVREHQDGVESKMRKKPEQKNTANTVKSYLLGGKHGSVYFTRREAECMLNIMKGRTIPQVAQTLSLSPRTIEYYINNMKIKLHCISKSELIQKVFDSEFLQNVDFKIE